MSPTTVFIFFFFFLFLFFLFGVVLFVVISLGNVSPLTTSLTLPLRIINIMKSKT